jgi:ubiquinone biosynthesis protein
MRMRHGAGPLPPLRRYRQIALVLMRQGLGDISSTLGLTRFVGLGRRLLPGRAAPAIDRNRRIRLALEELGPTFVKLGQALSTRSDLLPASLIAELSHLQDDAPPLAPGIAEGIIEREFEAAIGTLFADFDPTPVAAASMAQVHRAVLPDGQVVAVKVRRPDIGRIIEDDLSALALLARVVERRVPDSDLYSPSALVEQFARSIRREMDFRREGRIIEHFAANAAGLRMVRLPRVHWPLTTPAVLTMEYIAGAKLLDRQSWPPDADARQIARRGAMIILRQILVDGLFHADPHPGNILVLPGNAICLLDFGIVGRLDAPTKHHLTRLIQALSRKDAGHVAELLLLIAEPRGVVNTAEIQADVAELIDAYADLPLKDIPVDEVLHQALDMVSQYRLVLPADLMLLIKALFTIEGVGRALDPSFAMLAHAAPVADEITAERLSLPALADRAEAATRRAVEALETLPSAIGDVLRQVRSGRLQIGLEHRNIEELAQAIERSSVRLTVATIISAILLSLAIWFAVH